MTNSEGSVTQIRDNKECTCFVNMISERNCSYRERDEIIVFEVFEEGSESFLKCAVSYVMSLCSRKGNFSKGIESISANSFEVIS